MASSEMPIQSRRVASPASDMWQFGWALYDLFTRADADEMPRYLREHVLPHLPEQPCPASHMDAFIELLRSVQPPPFGKSKVAQVVHQAVLRCLDPNPESRATADEVMDRLGQVLGEPALVDTLMVCKSLPEAALSLRGTEISDIGLRRLEDLAKLKSLDIRDTRVTEGGLQRIKKKLPNCKVEF